MFMKYITQMFYYLRKTTLDWLGRSKMIWHKKNSELKVSQFDKFCFFQLQIFYLY